MKDTRYGKKIAAIGHDGKKKSGKAVIVKMISLIKTRGYYTEASDKMEAILRRSGVDNIKDEEVIKKIMGHKKDLVFEGDGYY